MSVKYLEFSKAMWIYIIQASLGSTLNFYLKDGFGFVQGHTLSIMRVTKNPIIIGAFLIMHRLVFELSWFILTKLPF